MKTNRKLIQTFLVSLGFLIIFVTYLLYPKIEKNRLKGSVVENEQPLIKDKDNENQGSKFEELEFRGFYNFDNPFLIASEEAIISPENSNIVYMTNIKITIEMNDGRTVIIVGDKGKYNKATYDCYLENNVIASDGETEILSDNLNLLSSKDSASIYNNVVVNNKNGQLKADKVDYNFESKYYKISMFKDKRVKIKLIE
tara:strand:+ start:177 stop:773 length:597 start_codon:yes stop_codon:yes gene_type:complete